MLKLIIVVISLKSISINWNVTQEKKNRLQMNKTEETQAELIIVFDVFSILSLKQV